MSARELPEGFSYDDFMKALDALDEPGDETLPTDAHGCVELVTMPATEVPSTVQRLREASIDPHVELPDAEERDATASVFVPRGNWPERGASSGSFPDDRRAASGFGRRRRRGGRHRGLMTATKTLGNATREDAMATFGSEGCSSPRPWANGPGDTYGWHEHAYHKVLFCLAGSIVFHTDDGDVALDAGDRLDLPAGTRHGATVGPDGCACVEASR